MRSNKNESDLFTSVLNVENPYIQGVSKKMTHP